MKALDTPMLSIVVPCFNDASGLREFHRRTRDAAMCEVGQSYEIVLVDDGSRDSTWQVIEEIAQTDFRVLGMRLTRNFGHQAAVTAGLAMYVRRKARPVDRQRPAGSSGAARANDAGDG